MNKLIFLIVFVITSLSAWHIKDRGEFSFKKINNNVYVMHGPIEEPNLYSKELL
jgi:hypothetical protein